MDNEAALKGLKNGNTTSRNKYYRVRIDALHEAYKDGIIDPVYMSSNILPADALTKSLSGPKLREHTEFLNSELKREGGVKK